MLRLIVITSLLAAGCGARVPARVVYRDGHRARLQTRAEEDLGCNHATLTPLGPRVVQAHGCGTMHEYAFTRARGWQRVTTVPDLAPHELGCPLELLAFRPEGPRTRVVEGCGTRARYDLACRDDGCAWAITARATDAERDLWPEPSGSLALAIEDPRLARGRDPGLLGVGLGLALAGLAGGFGLGIFDATHDGCTLPAPARGLPDMRVTCDVGAFSLVPIAGGLLASSLALDARRTAELGPILAGVVLGAAQIVGVVFVMVAVHGHTLDVVPARAPGQASLAPWGDATGGGLTLEIAL